MLQHGRCRANDGSIPIRQYRCFDCGAWNLTAELVIPAATSLGALDEQVRRRQRDYKRRINDYKGGAPRGGVRLSSDRLAFSVRVLRGKRSGYAA